MVGVAGITGSITKLASGLSYIEAGSNITVTTGSTGNVTIASTGGGAVANYTNNGNNRIVTSVDSDTINGEANLSFDGTDLTIAAAGKLLLRDSAINISSKADGELDIIADGRLGITSSLNADGAIAFLASAGGISMTAVGAAGEDISLSNTNGSVKLTSGEAVVDSVYVNSAGGILLDHDAPAGGVRFMNAGSTYLVVSQSAGDCVLSSSADTKDIIFMGDDAAEVFRIDGSAKSLLVASSKKIEFGDTGETISGDGNDLTITSGRHVVVDATQDITLDADGGDVFFKDAGTTILNVDIGNSVLYPETDIAFDLGKADKRFANIYTGDLHLKNNRGNWTLIEESSFLSLRNNKTGQRFKFLMELLPENDWDPDGTWTEPIE
jgi:hypothetical protein